MTGSRIWLDLSAFFSCVRKHSCIHVDHDKYRTVKDVENHICRLFGLKQDIQIVNDGSLLPSCESSLLLRDNDVVSVVSEEQPKFVEPNVKAEDAPAAPKCKEVNEVFKPPVKPVVTKVDGKSRIPIVTNGNGTVVSKENAPSGLKSSLKNPFAAVVLSLDKGKNAALEQALEQNSATMTNETFSSPPVLDTDETASEIGSECRKRKRIRRRKKKSTTEVNDDQDPKETKRSQYHANKVLQSVSYALSRAMGDNTATVNTVNSAPIVNNKRKHIFFEDPGDEELKKAPLTEEVKEARKSLLAEEPMDVNGAPVPQESRSSSNNNYNNNSALITHSISSPARGDGPLGLEKLLSLGNQKSPAVFERKKAEVPKTNEPNSNLLVPEQKMKKLTPLSDLPVKDTIIQFKVLKMCNYSPTISEPITARVVSPDVTKQQIFVEIKEGLSELQTEKGKFSLDLDETLNDDVSLGEYLLLEWKDLLEPKHVEYC